MVGKQTSRWLDLEAHEVLVSQRLMEGVIQLADVQKSFLNCGRCRRQIKKALAFYILYMISK